MNRKKPLRRGVLLLVIMGLLAMFGLVAVAFVMVAGQHGRSADAMRRVDEHLETPDKDLHQAAMQLFRGTSNAMSVLGPHSLLEDIYGTNTLGGTMTLVSPAAEGQLFEFDSPGDNPYLYLGRVLSIVNGPAAGKSTHIVGLSPVPSATGVGLYRLQATMFDGVDAKQFFNQCNASNPYTYMINGAPFSGTGAGYELNDPDPNKNGTLTQTYQGALTALLPNVVRASYGSMDPTEGGMNESWDAADYQNLFLGTPALSSTSSPLGYRLIPSFHRPELIKYWMDKAGASDLTGLLPDLLRAILLRPNPVDHEYFPGNPKSGTAQFNPINGPWDVDNDGDGIPDSIWIDLGMPVRSTADGRLYKPMYAVYCLDLDGRLNLNAHGNWAQAMGNYDGIAYYGQTTTADDLPGGGNARFADGNNGQPSINLPRGQGWGVGEINLLPLFQGAGADPIPLVMYQTLLGGDKSSLDGRYGDFALASKGQRPRPAFAANDSRLDGSVANPLHYNKWFEYTGNYWGFMTAGPYMVDSYGTPPDLVGAGAVGLDVAGRPLFASMGRDTHLPDVPYKTDLSRRAPRGATTPANAGVPDNPFGAAELERLLRPFDRDNPTLPGRLVGLSWINNSPHLMTRRHLLTTDSWDLPSPNVALPPALRKELREAPWNTDKRPPRYITDLLAAKGITDPKIWRQLLPPELLRGERMDLNRPFGNGVDDNGNLTVDEPYHRTSDGNIGVGETKPDGTLEELALYVNRGPMVYPQVDYDNGSGSIYTVRERQARYLYVLMMLLADTQYLKTHLPKDPNEPPDLDDDYRVARYLAQWAVNVVDFRDRDSIMTRFVFVQNPFTDKGWEVKDPTANPRYASDPRACVVWGCERPELLITETLAFHDRRTEDLDNETRDPSEPNDTSEQAGKTTDNDPKKKDASLDQRRRPLGSLFIELYNPWSANDPQTGELHKDQADSASTMAGVVLNQRTPAGHPVWRLTICKPVTSDEQPDIENPLSTQSPEIDRVVYFRTFDQQELQALPENQRAIYFTAQEGLMAPIAPGRYCVIGSGKENADPAHPGEFRTYLGEKETADPATTRRIMLKPSKTPGQTKVVYENGDDPSIPSKVQPIATVVINKLWDKKHSGSVSRRLSVTEAKTVAGYYPDKLNDASVDYDVSKDEYTNPPTPYDVPFDYQEKYHDGETETVDILKKNGTHTGFRVVHLQRLANPLLDYNANTNPYLTVDTMPIDLTVLNGLTKKADERQDSNITDATKTFFECRQRGESSSANNLWKQERFNKGAEYGSAGNISDHIFNRGLGHTLGYMNKPYGDVATIDWQDPGVAAVYKGDPQEPFPWLTWNNRPFASAHELMLVPALRSAKLLCRNEQDPNLYYGFATGDVQLYSADPNSTADPNPAPYRHLLNFFQSSKPDPNLGPDYGKSTTMQLHRLFEYVHVPSRFVGTTIQGNPEKMVGGDHWFHPPFHHIPTYREPGRINLNTIYYREVFYGLINDIPGVTSWKTFGDRPADDMWNRFVQSRRGDDDATDVDDFLAPSRKNLPTAFGRPFMAGASSDLMPLKELAPAKEIDATIMRSDPQETTKPLFQRNSIAHADNTDRNPYFRYEGLQKLSNLVTTRSNVYAVWITVGYFEVYPSSKGSPTHPDGYEIRQELGSDTGEINRHRAFYIFDRSIPVGFQRGYDMNVENAILVRRYIE